MLLVLGAFSAALHVDFAHGCFYFERVESSCWRYITCNFFGIDRCSMQALVAEENVLHRSFYLRKGVNMNIDTNTNTNVNTSNIVIQNSGEGTSGTELVMMQMMMQQQQNQQLMM
jgi:hypothetical protein